MEPSQKARPKVGFFVVVKSLLKALVGIVMAAVIGVVVTLLLVVFLPSRVARIKTCNYAARTLGPLFFLLFGCKVVVNGKKRLDRKRPAIYVSNHTSPLDTFLAAMISPVGTVGVAKKEVVYYPFFGQAYLLSGHLRIDRGRSEKAVLSIRRLGDVVRRHGLSIFMWPEGTRSRSGRLLPFKKGMVHLAIQTGLPVVPVVVQNTHRCWQAGSVIVRGVPIRVDVLEAVDTSGWSTERMEEAIDEVYRRFAEALPDDQKPEETKPEEGT